MATTKTNRKPGTLRTPSIMAKCHIDRGRVVVEIVDRAPWTDLGVAPPTDDELEKLTRWIRKVRSFRNNRNRKA
jgi:hypothetical protein